MRRPAWATRSHSARSFQRRRRRFTTPGSTAGSKATQSPRVGANVSAWDGYISGKNLELVPGKRIVQSWRTTKFTDADTDSKISVTLRAVPGGTRITLRHSRVPNSHTGYEHGGWQEHYFKPMKAYFTKQAARLERKYSGTKK